MCSERRLLDDVDLSATVFTPVLNVSSDFISRKVFLFNLLSLIDVIFIVLFIHIMMFKVPINFFVVLCRRVQHYAAPAAALALHGRRRSWLVLDARRRRVGDKYFPPVCRIRAEPCRF